MKRKDESLVPAVVSRTIPKGLVSEFPQSVSTIHASFDLNDTQLRILWSLMAHVHHAVNKKSALAAVDETNDKLTKFTIGIAELIELANIGSTRNRSWIWDNVREMQTKTIVTGIFDSEHRPVEQRSTVLFVEVAARANELDFTFSPLVLREVIKPQVFSRNQLEITNKALRSQHSRLLYNNTSRYRATGSTGFKPIEQWRAVLNAQDDSYDQFKYFSARILKPAIKDVNANSDITIELELQKTGRNVSAICFRIAVKPTKDTTGNDASSQSLMLGTTGRNESGTATLNRVIALGVTPAKAKSMAAEDPARLAELLTILDKQSARNSVANPAGFLVALWNNGTAAKNESALDGPEIVRASESLPVNASGGREVAEKPLVRRAYKWLADAPQEEVEQYVSMFLETEDRKQHAAFNYSLRKFSNPIFQLSFITFLAKKIA